MPDRIGHQLGNYRLLSELGRGAFAEVYLAEHLYLERLAAIKVLHVQMDPETQEHFRREARTVARLQHPHILQVLDFGIDEQTPYLVMQYTPGGTLREHHPKGTRLPVEQIVTYVKQIASALDYAHQQRVIHRDIKPHNLLLTAKSEVVLSDFGLAVAQQSLDALSLSNPAAGTPLYMAPEQIQYHPCAASDQYALGVMVYEWLAGGAPFRGDTLLEVFSHHLFQAPPSLRERLPDLPVAVEEVVFKALAKDPEQRFACVMDFASAFEEACEITQRLTMPETAKQRAQEPMVPQKTLFVPPTPARAPETSSASTQPAPMTVQGAEPGSVAVLVADRPTTSKPVKPSLAQNNRQRFLKRVRITWIEGMLNHSLQGAALMSLGLQEQADALVNPWHLVLHHADTAPRVFPVGTHIAEVYDTTNEELLILGAPGSGKTTLLLELARDLLDRAEQDAQQLMPVVFLLSSWAVKPQPLTEWMIEELFNKYKVPRQIARTWVETEQILPLLDGLDEVATEKRTTCIETINTYHLEHPFLPLVVSSRSADYLQQAGRLKLTTAVTIQSLTQQQVDDYLTRGGEALWTLRVALHQDASLRELAETPLMLSILTLTYHDMPVEDLLKGGIAPTRQQIFDRYVGRMLEQRGAKASYQLEQTRGWLTWLAKQLTQQGQTVFYLERLQPDWLFNNGSRRVYDWLAVRFPGILIGVCVALTIAMMFFDSLYFPDLVEPVLLGGLIGGLLSKVPASQQPADGGNKAKSLPRQQFLRWLVIGLLIGPGTGIAHGLSLDYESDRLSSGLIYGLSFGLCSILISALLGRSNTTKLSPQRRSPVSGTAWQNLISGLGLRNGLLSGLLVGLSCGLSYWLSTLSAGLSYGLSFEQANNAMSYGLKTGLINGLIFVFAGGLISVLLIGRSDVVQPTDKLIWSWTYLGRSLRSSQHVRATLQIVALVGLSAGLGYGVGHDYSQDLIEILNFGISGGLSLGLSFGLIYWLLIGLSEGVSSETVENQHRMVPNEGIRRSCTNGFLLGLVSAFIGMLSGQLNSGLNNGLFTGLSSGLSIGLKTGLLNGLKTGLSYGLSDALKILDYAPNPLSNVLLIGLGVGFLAGLLNGGLACWRHSVLRFLLWRNQSIPWNYSRFLDYAAEHILLRKVGGGYLFVHRLLLEYFASLDTTAPSDATSVKK